MSFLIIEFELNLLDCHTNHTVTDNYLQVLLINCGIRRAYIDTLTMLFHFFGK
jgi:hypothetical protein